MMERRVSDRAQGKGEGEQDVKSKTHNNKERERESGMTDRTEQYEHLMLGRFIPA